MKMKALLIFSPTIHHLSSYTSIFLAFVSFLVCNTCNNIVAAFIGFTSSFMMKKGGRGLYAKTKNTSTFKLYETILISRFHDGLRKKKTDNIPSRICTSVIQAILPLIMLKNAPISYWFDDLLLHLFSY